MRIPYPELAAALADLLLKRGFTAERAALCARLFADTTRDGVYSHGVNRFPRFLRMIANGGVDIHARPVLAAAAGALERWDGQRGPGNLNAHASMARAMELASKHGLGCVALANTNHWMRGGSYGWQAAEAGFAAICWTNTMPNLPPWGASVARIGNNPLILAVPRPQGHVVLDMAMSLFSYGALESYRRRGQPLPVEGGFDTEGRLTRDAAAIEESRRLLPAGYWKGSGLALLLDMFAALLSGGLATHQIKPEPERETSLSQIFLAFSPAAFGAGEALLDSIIASLHGAGDAAAGQVRYPGEQVLRIRAENLAHGVPVDPAVWDEIHSLA